MLKKLEIAIRKLILKLLLRSNKVERSNETIELNRDSKILIIRLNRIGDALVTTPLLRLIKENSDCKIHLLADKKNHFVFINNKFVDKIIVWEKGITSYKNLVKKLNQENYDAVIDTHDDISTTVTLLLTKLKSTNKIGFDKGSETIYSHVVPKPDSTKTHIIERVIKLVEPFAINPVFKNVNIVYEPMRSSIDFLDDYLKKENLDGKYLFGLNISAGSDSRFWGVERYKILINELKKMGVSPLLISAAKDLDKAKEISNGEIKIFQNESFDIFAALISKLNFLFTPDTSVVHLASAYNIPMFGIYVKFNTNDMVWYPYQSKYELVITEEENFKNLETSEVIPKFIEFFKKVYYEQTNTKL